MISDRKIEQEILVKVRQRGPEKTICPSEVARSLATDDWRDLMPRVRAVARNLVTAGAIVVTRKGQTVDPNTVKGAIRYRVTPQGDMSDAPAESRVKEPPVKGATEHSAGARNTIPVTTQFSDYAIRQLSLQEIAPLQALFEQCADFFQLTDGAPAAPTAAQAEFVAVPPEKSAEDVYIFGAFDAQADLIGVVSSLRHYPDPQTWWIGLMLLAPTHRGQGLGTTFYQSFERWVGAQGVSYISLCAIAPNLSGIRFWTGLGFELVRTISQRTYGLKIHDVHIFRRAIQSD